MADGGGFISVEEPHVSDADWVEALCLTLEAHLSHERTMAIIDELLRIRTASRMVIFNPGPLSNRAENQGGTEA